MDNTLDPDNWPQFRQQAHQMLDDMLDYLQHRREQPLWQPSPDTIKQQFQVPLPQKGQALEDVHQQFMQQILPYAVGNTHPGFMGWVHGGGTPVGMLAEMLTAGLNANLGGRSQIPICVEQQITRWMAEVFHFPIEAAGGIFVTGTSMANFLSVLVAQTRCLSALYRIQGCDQNLTAYCCETAHQSISQAFSMAGLGTQCLRIIPADKYHKMHIGKLQDAILADKARGLTPFYCAATVGTVDCAAIDDLTAVSEICQQENLWFHVDGAFGALAQLSPALKPLLAGIEKADSIAFDFHKWLQVPYDAGFVLFKDKNLQYQTFADNPDYLQRTEAGLAGGDYWPCDYGPDLSRGFKALKTWFTIQHFGAEKLAAQIQHSCFVAKQLAALISEQSELELLMPVGLNIVCFRYRPAFSFFDEAMSEEAVDHLNENIVTAMQLQGRIAPSTTRINGKLAIRAAIVNHRTDSSDIEALVTSVIQTAREFHEVSGNPFYIGDYYAQYRPDHITRR